MLVALAMAACQSPRGSVPGSPAQSVPAACIVTSTPSYPPRSPSPPAYSDHVLVSEAQTAVRPITVSPSLLEAGVQAFWDAGDVRLSIVSPSGRVVDRTTEAPDVLHPGGPTSQTLVVKHPDAGQWMIQLYGASVQASGEQVSLSVTEIPQSDFAPIEYVSAVPDRGVAP